MARIIGTIAVLGAMALVPSLAVAQAPSIAPVTKIIKIPAPPATDIFETTAKVPVTVKLQDGTAYTAEIAVTHYHPRGAGPFPAVAILHGRSSNRAEPARVRFLALARFFTRRGFAVFVPTRIGYGEGGLKPDPENAGSDCVRRDYRPPLAAIVSQIEATWTIAKSLPHVDGSRLLLVGHSYGGFGAIGATGASIPGLIGAINFAGGGGGNPISRSGNPCSPEKIAAIYQATAPKSKVPTLWLYAENDQYWGRTLPTTWHKAFADHGGKGELVMYPPTGEDGHKLPEALSLWRPQVDAYLTSLGFPPPRSAGNHSSSGFAPLSAAETVPYINETARREGYKKFLAGDLPRAFAVAPGGAWGASWGQSAEAPTHALDRCQKHAKTGCRLYAVDDAVVFVPEQASSR